MKKIAFCLRDMQLGGVESVLCRTLEHLSDDKNFDITVVCFVDVSEPVYLDWFRAHPNIKRIVLYPSKIFGTKMPRFFLWRVIKHFCRDVYRFVRRYFVVHHLAVFDTIIDWHDFGFAKEFKKIKNVKKIAWFHSSISVFQKRNFSQNLCVYDKIVVLTDDCVNFLRKQNPNYADKFIRVYNPIDVLHIRDMAIGGAIVDGDYFCCVSRMAYDKDIKTVLDAFDLFYKNHKNVKMVFVGGGDKLSVFQKYANKLKSAQNILFVGAQKNPYVYMAHAVANVLSSYGEGLPTVLLEAQVLNVLNISSNCKCGPREILMDGAAGMLFEPGNVSELAKCMADVYDKNVDVDTMCDMATHGVARFNSDIIMNQIKSLIS